MANPADISFSEFAVLTVSTTTGSVTLNKKRTYSIAHLGRDNTGAASTVPVYLAEAATTDPDASEGADKAILLDGGSFDFGPGVTSLTFATTASSVTVLVVGTGPK